MVARKMVMGSLYTPDLTKKILKLTEGHDTNYSIIAIKIALSVLNIELEEPKILKLYPNNLLGERHEGEVVNDYPVQ